MTNQRSFSLIRRHTTVRLTTDAVLIAVYVALASFVSINLPIAQFSLSSLPILLCVFALGNTKESRPALWYQHPQAVAKESQNNSNVEGNAADHQLLLFKNFTRLCRN